IGCNENAGESDDKYDYDELEESCTCECSYYDDCICDCECEDCAVEIEVLSDFAVISWDGLYDVFTNLMTTDGPYAIDISNNITMNAQLNIPAGRTVYLTGVVLYQPTANARHFTVDGTLTLNGITLRGTGAAAYRGGIMVNGGELIMNAGSVIEGNRAIFGGGVQIANGAIFTMHGGTISNNSAFSTAWGVGVTGGGGVWTECSTFTMHDGVIKNNIANNMGGSLAGSFGGGIGGGGNVGSGFESTFTMNGGHVSGNVARYGGGIRLVNSNVTINAGTISENEAIVVGVSGEGGGLELMFANLTINGGAITGNGARYGGGIRLVESTATMNGGLISGNETIRSGGGVNLTWDSTFTMNNGTISENESQTRAGGVGVNISSEFIMTGGMISNNIARLSSGGVNVNFESTFIMKGGVINGNTAGTIGGGVYLSIDSAFTMSDGNISNNTAGTNGGGVFVDGSNMFTMTGGTIDGNTARLNGGGIYLNRWIVWSTIVYYGMFNMMGGAITNNIAETGDGGGIFSGAHESYPNPLTPTAYHNIILENGTILGNTSGNGRYALPDNYYERTFGHLLNNNEINFRGSHRVEAIIFELNGGNVGGDMDDIEAILAYDIQVGMANVPIPELFGYSLTGWQLGGKVLTSTELAETVVNEPMTFVAQWTRNPGYWFTVTFAPGAQGVFAEQVFTDILHGTATPTFIGTPTGNEGWIFTGWSPTVATTVTANVTYVAQWEEIVPDREYRSIHIYYYLLENGELKRDLENNPHGRQYYGVVGDAFNLEIIGVLDRNELAGDNEYVFVGWRIYVGGVHDQTYLEMNANRLLATFTVPGVLSIGELFLDENILALSDFGVAETIGLVAVWSIVDAQEGGNDGSNDSQQKLPATGVESDMALWSMLLTWSLIVMIGTMAVIRTTKKSRNK
ncbi:MAG: hypothetical protein FWD05_13785, partial [Oscillospiraceae bacterium]|nr:hypothetical protein [Oscillospiraceae bacterium]